MKHRLRRTTFLFCLPPPPLVASPTSPLRPRRLRRITFLLCLPQLPLAASGFTDLEQPQPSEANRRGLISLFIVVDSKIETGSTISSNPFIQQFRHRSNDLGLDLETQCSPLPHSKTGEI
ncbi:unnamed protein product [Linum trigynum]|uniref:Uncharacterized protein n=1 Tax=Linum trigynum TaxID=586398 RepID=A0AAV2FK56_9ROSI